MYVKTVAPPGAKIFFVGEAPGEYEDQTGKPFHPQAAAGGMFDRLLAQAGINRYECIIGNVAREWPPGGKMAFYYEDSRMTKPKPILKRWIEELKNEIILYKPNIVVGLGAHALWALTGEKGIEANRGYILPCTLVPHQKVLCTYNPMKINYEWKLGFATTMDFRKAVKESVTPETKNDTRSLNAFPSKREFKEYLGWLINVHQEPIALDIETTPSGHLDILGIAASPTVAQSFTFVSGGKARFKPEDEFGIWLLLAELFKNKSIIMHNGLFDMASMWHFLGILARGYDKDTMMATHVCWPETPRSLSFISSICLNVPKWKHTSQTAPSLYNAEDAANTYGCWEFLSSELDKLGGWDTFNFEMAQVWPASMLQLQGIAVDPERQKKIIQETHANLNRINDELTQDIGKTINFNSPIQLQELLYEDMRLPVQYKRRKSRTEKRKQTANAEALTKLLRTTGNPILAKILEYKKLRKLLTFVDIPVSPQGRVHTSYNITGATMQRQAKGLVVDDEDSYRSFGRWSSSKSIILPYGSGNLQNIPYAARKMYAAPDGYVFVQADYMQAEAVVVAYCINDQPMIQLFKESFGLRKAERKERNLDIHKLTAAINFRIPIANVTPEQRQVGKTIRHATNYSAGPGVLAAKLGCTLPQAKQLLSNFHNGCPQLRMWHQWIQQELRKTRTLINLLGRKHKFLERWGDNLFRSAYSFIPQSTVGDMLNQALVRLYNTYGDELTISLQLHDAIYVIVKEDLVDWACSVLRQCMLMPLEVNGYKFYVDIDFSKGKTWGELEEYDPEYTHQVEVDYE